MMLQKKLSSFYGEWKVKWSMPKVTIMKFYIQTCTNSTDMNLFKRHTSIGMNLFKRHASIGMKLFKRHASTDMNLFHGHRHELIEQTCICIDMNLFNTPALVQDCSYLVFLILPKSTSSKYGFTSWISLILHYEYYFTGNYQLFSN